MKQLLNKPIVIRLVMPIILLSSISAREPMWSSNMPQLTQDIKNACIQFQLQKGSNRIAEYTKIEQGILIDKTISRNKNDIIKILGPPNKTTTMQLQYWLQEDTTKAIATILINN